MNCSKLINIVMIVLAGCLFIIACATIGVWAKQYSKPMKPNNATTKPPKIPQYTENPHEKESGGRKDNEGEFERRAKEIILTGNESDDNTLYDSVIGCAVTLMLLAICQMVVCFMRILSKILTFLIWAILNGLIFLFYIVCFGILCDRLKIFSFVGFHPAGNASATDKQVFKQTADTGKALTAFCGVAWMSTFGGIIGAFFVGHKKVEKPPEPEDREVVEKKRKKSSKLYLQQQQVQAQRKSQGEEVPSRPQQQRKSQGDPLKPKSQKEKENKEHHQHYHKGHHQKN